MRRALGALLLALGRDPGVTLIETDRWTLAEELWSFGEDSLYPVALQLSDEDMVRLWLLAGGLLVKERARSSGEATALAAVAVSPVGVVGAVRSDASVVAEATAE